MEHRLDVFVSAVDGAAFIRPEGDLDVRGADGFENQVRTALRREPEEILVDLRGVTFLDSIGLRSLFRTCYWCDREHVALCVVPGSAPVRRLLRVTGADMQLPLTDDAPPRLRGLR
jgi:anti-sigma B factor antagonist